MSHHKLISCAEAVARLYDYLDREGPDAAIEEVEAHLDICRYCCNRFAFEASLWKVVSDRGKEGKCPDSLKLRIEALFTDN